MHSAKFIKIYLYADLVQTFFVVITTHKRSLVCRAVHSHDDNNEQKFMVLLTKDEYGGSSDHHA